MTHPVYAFDNALVRAPGASSVHGLRAEDRGAPDLIALRAEHDAYIAALGAAGVAVERLPALEAFPDSMFVEDPALVFHEGAILLRPGAASRAGEAEAIAPALHRRFARVLDLPAPGTADGGDVLVLPDRVLIGLSARTDAAGAAGLVGCLAQLGRRGEVVRTPPGVLHFKSDCALLDEETVLATTRLAASGIFAGLRVLRVPEGEEPAANALRVNDVVFAARAYPRTAEVLARAGYTVVPLDVAQVALLDAGLSCMSLRWRAG
jgi:dimethylargininase